MLETLPEEVREQIRKEQAVYLKEWRAKNPDKVKQHNLNYWRKRIEEGGNGNEQSTKNEND